MATPSFRSTAASAWLFLGRGGGSKLFPGSALKPHMPKAESRISPTNTPSITMSSGETRMGW